MVVCNSGLPKAVALIVSGLVLWCPSPAAASGPDADAIVQSMLKADAAQRARRDALAYVLVTTREKLDEKGGIVSSATGKERVVGDKKMDYGTRDTPEDVEKALAKASREEPFELLSIIDHYSFSLDGERRVNGQACYAVRYTPKPDQPFRNREEKVLNQVSGTLCVRKSDYTLMKNEGVLQKPVSVAWFFATLRELRFGYESTLLPNGDYGPGRVTYQFLVRVPFAEIRERHERRMTEYRFR